MGGDLVGTTLGGRFDVIGFIAMGGMGEVYRARDRDLDEIVALKVIREDLVANASVIERFRHEVKLARRVTHHNVARTYELGRDDTVTFCTMELIEGAPLSRRMVVQGMPIGEVATIATALCGALDAAHRAGVIHRDVKPDNVLVAHDGRVVLTDFGIAAVGHGEIEWGGTPRYMAPEQARGEQPTPLADIYALGVIVYEMLAGQPAFAGNAIEILAVKQDVEHLRLAGDFDPRLVAIVAQATAFDPAMRYATAEALRRELAPWVAARAATEPQRFPHVDDIATVAVRPAQTNDHDSAHLAFGFRQALVTRLGKIPHLRVSLTDTGEPEHTVADLAAGSDSLRLSLARPVEATTLALDVPLDPARLLHEVERATRVVAAMVGVRVPELAAERPLAADALDLMLRARHTVFRGPDPLEQALALCERAHAIAPDDPRILALHAKRLSELAFMTQDAEGSRALLEEAGARVRAAFARDPRCAEASVVSGQLELHRGDPVAAAVHFRAAIASEPLLADAHLSLGRALVESGYLVDAFRRLADARALSADVLAGWGERVRALALEGEWLEVDSAMARIGTQLGRLGAGRFAIRLRLIVWRGNYADYDADLVALKADLSKETSNLRGLMMMVCDHMRGVIDGRPMIEKHLQTLESASARRRAVVCQLAAETAGHVGDAATCLGLLERATRDGMFDLHWLDRCPLLAVARDTDRFRAVRAVVEQRANAIHDALFGEQPAAERATAFSVMQVSHAATLASTR